MAVRREGVSAFVGVLPDRPSGIYTMDDLLEQNFVQTGSVVMRRSAYSGIPRWLDNARMLDWPIFIMSALHGNLLLLDDVMGVYRIHEGGVWSMASALRNRLEIARVMGQVQRNVPLTRRQRRVAGQMNARRFLALAWDLFHSETQLARYCAIESLRADRSPRLLPARLYAVLATHTPRLAAGLRWCVGRYRQAIGALDRGPAPDASVESGAGPRHEA
jgi:hypothetical protein